jgi:hypothetical protein
MESFTRRRLWQDQPAEPGTAGPVRRATPRASSVTGPAIPDAVAGPDTPP